MDRFPVGPNRSQGKKPYTMARSTTTKTAVSFIVAVGMIVILAAFAVVAAGSSAAPSPAPTDRPSPVPTEAPSPVATPTPVPVPSPVDPVGQGIVLDVADDHEVVVVIANASDTVTGARSGVAKDGMSVRWGDVIVENVDDDTLRLTWAGWLQDESITVAVAAEADALSITVTQKMPYENTDAMGGDRVLEIDLAQPFDADDVRAEFVAAS
jgi:hypothetical protein